MFVDGAGQVRLVRQPEDILKRNERERRGGFADETRRAFRSDAGFFGCGRAAACRLCFLERAPQFLPVRSALFALRSRIRHSATTERATLILHTFETFAADVLAPHHAQLGLPGLPTSIDEFAGWEYPAPGVPGTPPSHATLLKRLRDMQAALRFLYTKCRRITGQNEVIYQASVNSIATAIGKSRDSKAVVLRVEPFLIEQGYLQVTHGGRRLTDEGVLRAIAL